MDATIRLRSGQLAKYRAMAGLTRNRALADAMGLHPTTLARTINGDAELSGRFIAGLLTVFEHLSFDDLFDVVTNETAEGEDTDPAMVGVA